jgi:hypothetical protein
VPNPDTERLPPPDVGSYPLREAYLCHFREQDRLALVAPLDLLLCVLLEGGDAVAAYLPGRRPPPLADEAAAIARDLEFSARCLVTVGEGADLPAEQQQLAGFCQDLGGQVAALAAALSLFVSTWRGPERRP